MLTSAAGKFIRHRECNNCKHRAEKLRRVAQADRKLAQYIKRVNAANADERLVVSLTGAIIRQLGGFESFVEKLTQVVETAETSRKHRYLTPILGAVINLVSVSNAIKDKHQPGELLTDDDLRRQAQDDLVELVKQNPELAVWAASQLPEWRLVPVGEIVTPTI